MKKGIALTALAGVLLVSPALVRADHSSDAGEETHVEEMAHETEAVHVEDTHDATPSVADALIGTRSEAVKALQAALIAQGLLSIDAPTGYYGSLTAAAVAKLGVMTPSHAHEPLDVSDWNKVPRVSIELHEDALAGYNLEVKVSNFEFAPEHVNGNVKENEGHAHVYVNGTKYARLYGSWMHLPAALFTAKENEVRVTLNANDHSDLAYEGALVEVREHVHAH